LKWPHVEFARSIYRFGPGHFAPGIEIKALAAEAIAELLGLRAHSGVKPETGSRSLGGPRQMAAVAQECRC